MKILMIHSYYSLRGGEDAVFEQECLLLKDSNEVIGLTFHNQSSWKGALQFLFSIWNFSAANRVKRSIREHRPDLLHLQNWHFACGPLVIRIAKRMNIPVVVTLHNYRLLCPSSILLKDGKVFTDSIHAKFPWTAIRCGLYRNSVLQTFWLAAIVWFHKQIGTWKMVDKYIVLSEFVKEIFLQSRLGIPEKKFYVKPNFVIPKPAMEAHRGDRFLYVGRLSTEKGINLLLKAFSGTDCQLEIAGEGPMLDAVQSAAAAHSNIRYLGTLNSLQVQEKMNACTALVFPSVWYEPFGLVIIEAFSQGCPVIAADDGSPKFIVHDGENGLHFKSGDAGSLMNSVRRWQSFSEEEKGIYRKNAWISFQNNYTEEINKEKLEEIYRG